MKNKTQNQQILDYIREHGSISSYEAFLHLKILRLSARIFDLKEAGHNITDITVTKDNKSYKRYSLENGQGDLFGRN